MTFAIVRYFFPIYSLCRRCYATES